MGVSRETDTIAAIATAPGRGGIGVVRVSGKDLTSLLAGVMATPPKPREAALRTFKAADGTIIDQGVAIHFPAPASYTGESVLELQGHGGPAVLAALLRRCLELGCRIAEPGEFTQRAFLNGRLDLVQAEGVADLIEAASEQAARSAARTMVGDFSARVHELSRQVEVLRVHVEACIDFPEEEIDPADRAAQAEKLARAQARLDGVLEAASLGAVLRDGLTVALIGRPNVGKSSLLNRLAGEELAIVTPIPGTTRDHVRATIYLEGVPIHLIDTAGLRETDDVVERMGIDRTWRAIERAGAALVICEAGAAAGREEAEIVHRLPKNLPIAWVYNKIDLFEPAGVSRETSPSEFADSFRVSALTGDGLDGLKAWLLDAAGWQPAAEGAFLARERHLQALRTARTHLELAGTRSTQFELYAEELRLAHHALGAITGEVTSDDLLGEIFSNFCIGK